MEGSLDPGVLLKRLRPATNQSIHSIFRPSDRSTRPNRFRSIFPWVFGRSFCENEGDSIPPRTSTPVGRPPKRGRPYSQSSANLHRRFWGDSSALRWGPQGRQTGGKDRLDAFHAAAVRQPNNSSASAKAQLQQ